jgi:hypothetical protein
MIEVDTDTNARMNFKKSFNNSDFKTIQPEENC